MPMQELLWKALKLKAQQMQSPVKALHTGQCNRGDQWSIKATLLCLWTLALFRGQ